MVSESLLFQQNIQRHGFKHIEKAFKNKKELNKSLLPWPAIVQLIVPKIQSLFFWIFTEMTLRKLSKLFTGGPTLVPGNNTKNSILIFLDFHGNDPNKKT